MNGLLIQWGIKSANSSVLQTVTFDVDFTTKNYVGFANINTNSDTSSGWGYIYNKNYSSCQFVIRNSVFDWIVIGY